MKRLAAVLIILLGLFLGVPVADAQELKFSIISDIIIIINAQSIV